MDVINWDTLMHNPSMMVYFAYNRNGVACYIHANKRRKKRGSGEAVDIWKVDWNDCEEAWRYKFIDFMNETESNYVVCDGVKMQYKQEIIDCVAECGINVHPSTTINADHGHPPCSHCIMPLDYRLFAPYQQAICEQTSKLEDEHNFTLNDDSRLALLYDLIEPTLINDEMIALARQTIDGYGDVCRRFIDKHGNIKGFK